MIKSISTQTGGFSYSLNIEFTGYDPFELGWSGESKIFSFSGQSGRMYDNSSREFYSYSRGESLTLSGNRVNNYNNYFVNDVLFSSNNSQNTGYVESFFSNGPVSPQITFKGNLPNYVADSGVLINGDTTGLFDVFNLNSEVGFKIYSGDFSSDSLNFNYPFDSGSITYLKSFPFNSTTSYSTETSFNVNVDLYTNFGFIQKEVSIYSLWRLITDLSLFGPSVTDVTGNYDYNLSYNLSSGSNLSLTPFPVNYEILSRSGIGDYVAFTGGTGYYTGTDPLNLTIFNTISNSGQLKGFYDIQTSGFSNYINENYTGSSTGIYKSGIYYATGDFLYPYAISASGLATGTIFSLVGTSTGAYNFEATGLLQLSGDSPSGQISFTTGIDHTGYWFGGGQLVTVNNTTEFFSPLTGKLADSDTDIYYEYYTLSSGFGTGLIQNIIEAPSNQSQFNQDFVFGFTGELPYGWNIVTGSGLASSITGTSTYGFNPTYTWFVSNLTYEGDVTGRVFSSGTTGIITGEGFVSGDALLTGYTGVNFKYYYISKSNDLTGYFNESVSVTGQSAYTSSTYDLTGMFYHRVRSDRYNYFDYNFTETGTINRSAVVYFTGDYSSNGTGAFIGGISKEGYTGAGVGGSVESYSKTFLTGNEKIGLIDKSLSSLNLLPLKSFDSNSPLEISGNSGIAIIPIHTNELAPIYDFSSNDSARQSYIKNPSWIRYKWMDGTTTISDEVDFKFSPLYYASGTGIYMDTNSISARLSYYSGTYPNLDYKSNSTFSFDDFNGWKRIETNYSYFAFDDNKEQWEMLFTAANTANVPDSGFFFLAWEDQSSSTQDNAPKVFNSYLGDTENSPTNSVEIVSENPNPKAIFSFRKINEDYTGNSFSVERSQDSATETFGFVNGYANFKDAINFCGTGYGYLSGWFDQSNNGYHLTGDGSKPIIISGEQFQTGAIFNNNVLYTSGNFGLTKNDPITTIFTADISTFETYGTMWAQNWSDFDDSFSVGVHANLGNKLATDQWAPRGSAASGDPVLLNTNYTFAVHAPVIEQHLTGGASFWTNGEGFEGSGYGGSVANNLADAPLAVGGFGTLGNGHWNGRIQEIIIYDSNITGNIPSLSAEMTGFWNNPYKVNGKILSEDYKYPTGVLTEGYVYSEKIAFNSGFKELDNGYTLTGSGQAILSIDGNVTGSGDLFATSKNVQYVSSTGYQGEPSINFIEILTGAFNGDIIYFHYEEGMKVEDYLGEGYTTDYFVTQIKNYTIGADYADVEAITGDIGGLLTPLGYDIGISNDKLQISGQYHQYINFGLDTDSNEITPNFTTFAPINQYWSGQDFQYETINGVVSNGGDTNSFLSFNEKIGTGSFYNTAFTGQFEITGFVSGQWIERDDISGRFDLETSLGDILLDTSFTGILPATGMFTGFKNVAVSAGTDRTVLSDQFNYSPFSGLYTGIPLIRQGLDVLSYEIFTGDSWSGNLTDTVYLTGDFPMTIGFSGLSIVPSLNTQFTGAVTGVGLISGDYPLTIDVGSGVYQVSGNVTGNPNSVSTAANDFNNFLSGGVAIEPFTGFINKLFTGTGFYSEDINVDIQGSGFDLLLPTYRKTFTGEYSLFTGLNVNNLVENKDYDSIISGYTGQNFVTGQGQIIYRLQKRRNFEGYDDNLFVYYSGEGLRTGGFQVYG